MSGRSVFAHFICLECVGGKRQVVAMLLSRAKRNENRLFRSLLEKPEKTVSLGDDPDFPEQTRSDFLKIEE